MSELSRIKSPALLDGLDELRDEFVRLMTTDSSEQDRRKRDFNQALFDMATGESLWAPCVDMEMVLEKFDKAVRNLGVKR